jgi:NitT/TauT family transport system ATP-binding protein
MAELNVINLSIEYRELKKDQSFCAVKDITVKVRDREIVCVVGPSGCGKSSLLGAMAGLVPYSSGSIEFNGEKVVGPRADTSLVFQKAALMPWWTAVDNVAYPLRIKGLRRAEAREKAMAVLEMAGLREFAKFYPYQLSGGMQQRVNISRALVINPEMLLLDEPFASVDAQMRAILQEEVLSLLQVRQGSAVFVTHQIEEAVLLGDRVVIMSGGPEASIHQVLDIPLGHPRSAEVRTSATFAGLVDQVWDSIRADAVLAARNIREGH